MTKPTKWPLRPARLRSAWASVFSLRCPHEETFGPQLPIECTAKTLIRLGGCPGWYASLLGTQTILLVLSWGGSYIFVMPASAWCYIGMVVGSLSMCVSTSTVESTLKIEILYLQSFGWYSGGHRVVPPYRHISFVEIWSWNNFYSLSFPTADSSWAVVSYWQKYGHLVLVNCLGSLPRNNVDMLTDWLNMTIIMLTGP